jgi:hypothetical protein
MAVNEQSNHARAQEQQQAKETEKKQEVLRNDEHQKSVAAEAKVNEAKLRHEEEQRKRHEGQAAQRAAEQQQQEQVKGAAEREAGIKIHQAKEQDRKKAESERLTKEQEKEATQKAERDRSNQETQRKEVEERQQREQQRVKVEVEQTKQKDAEQLKAKEVEQRRKLEDEAKQKKEVKGEFEPFFRVNVEGDARDSHRNQANRELERMLMAEPTTEAEYNKKLGHNVLEHMRSGSNGLKNPLNVEWHHSPSLPNTVEMMRKEVHRDSENASILHPDGRGGHSRHNQKIR